MQNISFFLTTEQVRNKTKTVTRRAGWWNLKPGETLNACVKCQGLKKGEKIEHICQIRIKSVKPEMLRNITKAECILEGFPEMEPEEFIRMFCSTHKGCTPDQVINRIEFVYV